jgi:SNF2 family DNA or RNA helicase
MISQYLKDRFGSNSVVEFYGAVTKKNRIEAINKFSKESQFFIANKTCAGYGLNLQFCRNAIYYSNDFDFATRMQSEDRIHRIGQEDEVYIYDIYAAGTVDRQILNCLFKKESMVENFKKWIDYYKNDKSIDKSNIK